MGRITSSVGLVSGIDTTSIINQLMALEEQPKTQLQTRKDNLTAQKAAYTGILTQLNDLKTVGTGLERPSTFTASTAKSSDENVLTATAGASAAVGSYQFQVAQLVTAQQGVTNGYSDSSALVGAGTLTLEMGGGSLDSQTALSQLNGGAGVRRGQFRVTDGAGKSAVVDTGTAVTLDDVVKKINTSLDVSVHASVKGDGLVLTDTSGQSGALSVQDLAGGSSAADLGIVGTGANGVLTGTDVNSLTANTSLNALNDGRGVRTVATANATGTGPDFTVTLGDGSQVSVALGSSRTIGDVLAAVNKAGGAKLKASIGPGGKGITLTDSSGGGGALSVAAVGASKAAADLGLLKTGSAGTLNGSRLIAGLDSVLVSSLKGGAGVALGQISVTDRAGHASTVNLSSAASVQDVLDTINAAATSAGVGVTASLNSSGNGIQLSDHSGGTGNLVVGDGDANKTATALGLAGTFDATKPADNGANLQLAWVNENTLLSSYNGGKGVTPGSFKITNAAGAATTVDLSQGVYTKLGDVIAAVNGAKAGVTASINANGDGLLLTDTTGGGGKLKVENGSGTTATDLNIAGTATGTGPGGNTINGSFEKTIDINSADTLQTVQGKIQSLGFGVSAAIINDGSGASPYRLSVTSLNSGRAGRVVFDGGTTSLSTHDLVSAQDAAVFLGGAGAAQPLLVTSSTNQLANVIPGVTINLQGVSSSPVSLNVTRDPSSVVDQVKKFSDGFNAVVDKITDLTKWDSDKNTGGLLLGDATISDVQNQMYTVLNSAVTGAGRYRVLADIGITVTDGAKLQFDSDKFRSAFATDPEAVKNLFSQANTGLGAVIDKSMTDLVDPVNGVIPRETKTLDTQAQQFQDRMDQLDALIAQKRTRLETQFANMESALAGLQSQQSALSSLTGVTSTASAAPAPAAKKSA